MSSMSVNNRGLNDGVHVEETAPLPMVPPQALAERTTDVSMRSIYTGMDADTNVKEELDSCAAADKSFQNSSYRQGQWTSLDDEYFQ